MKRLIILILGLILVAASCDKTVVVDPEINALKEQNAQLQTQINQLSSQQQTNNNLAQQQFLYRQNQDKLREGCITSATNIKNNGLNSIIKIVQSGMMDSSEATRLQKQIMDIWDSTSSNCLKKFPSN